MRISVYTAISLLIITVHANAGIIADDCKALLTFDNLKVATMGLGIAGTAHTWDDELEGRWREAWLIKHPSDLTDIYGSSHFNLPVSLALWGAGRLSHRQQLADIGSALLRTLALTQLAVGPIKWTVRRDRPDRSSQLSFPSGHTANSFALARLFHRQYGLRVGIPLYVAGAFTGAGRMEGDKHYLSDVIMGAVLGTIVGNAVTLSGDSRIRVLPQISAEGSQLLLYIEL